MHTLMKEGRLLLVPGVYDALSARIAERAGFPAVVLSGYAMAASRLGEPDLGLLTHADVVDSACRVASAVDIAVMVDGDTGFGGPLNVQRLVRDLIRARARGVLLEDQTWPKRCGHMRGKSVIEAEEHAAKIHAAVDARGEAPFTITARTDALETHGVDEAIRRARLYKEAGADVLFVEGPRSRDELRRIGAELPGPLAVNLIEGGRTPICSPEELVDMGFFSIGFVLTGLFAAAAALERAYAQLFEHGSSGSLSGEMMDFERFNRLIGLEKRLKEDEKYKPAVRPRG
ncbi:MAG: isocitrate lyase/PEP mutase family protein [Deltaproteobacteria bacterium]